MIESTYTVEGETAWELESVAELNELEAKADTTEAEASDLRWQQAERVAALIDADWTQQEIAGAWKRTDGTTYSRQHVQLVQKLWECHLSGIWDERPRWNEAYNSPEVRKANKKSRDAPPAPPPPQGEYQVLYVDPPWRYEHAEPTREVENHYPTMSLDEIKALQPPAANDSILFMWATSPKLAEALQVVEAWGFTYRTCMVWVKDRIGMGYYARQRHELLLIAKRGTHPAPEPADRPDSVIEAPRGAHSAKPPQVYDVLEAMYPDSTRIELFARNKRDGWDSWGNEA